MGDTRLACDVAEDMHSHVPGQLGQRQSTWLDGAGQDCSQMRTTGTVWPGHTGPCLQVPGGA